MKALAWRGPPVSIGDDGVGLIDWEHGQPEDRYRVEWAIQNDPPPPGNGHWLYTAGQWRRLTDAEAVVVCRGGQVWAVARMMAFRDVARELGMIEGTPVVAFDDGEGKCDE